MAANASTAKAESGIKYISRFIRSPPKVSSYIHTSNFFIDCNKPQKIGKGSATLQFEQRRQDPPTWSALRTRCASKHPIRGGSSNNKAPVERFPTGAGRRGRGY